MLNIRKGFVKTSILIAVIAGMATIGGVGYFGIGQYKNYQVRKIEEERLAREAEKLRQEEENLRQEKDKQTQKVIFQQQQIMEELQRRLEESQTEIQGIKTENQQSKDKQKQEMERIQRELDIEKSKPENLNITSDEINSYLTAVVHIVCNNSEGSGFLYKIDESFYAITNQHVVQTPLFDKIKSINYCGVLSEDKSDEYQFGGLYEVHTAEFSKWNKQADITVFKLYNWPAELPFAVRPIDKSNYNLSSLRLCQPEMQLGSSVVVIGWPVFSKIGSISSRAITNGIISAYDQITVFNKLPHKNYFVSAKIDSGNSGGIALSKDEKGLCFLGVPTWLNVGNYENQGMIQNIHNVFFVDN